MSLCLNQLYCGREQINVFFFFFISLHSLLSLHKHRHEFSLVSPGGDNSKAPSLWKHIQFCWSNKNTKEENQQQTQVSKLLAIEPKLLPKLLF